MWCTLYKHVGLTFVEYKNNLKKRLNNPELPDLDCGALQLKAERGRKRGDIPHKKTATVQKVAIKHSEEITDLLSPKMKWLWTDVTKTAFQKIRNASLQHLNYIAQLLLVLQTDCRVQPQSYTRVPQKDIDLVIQTITERSEEVPCQLARMPSRHLGHHETEVLYRGLPIHPPHRKSCPDLANYDEGH
ncbi:hypothetical protein HHI36_018287 [Cryptolaemus montrouzieri]|uniref:Uncharacterized protein n=1 Tax=Cryptolaemus montrouzieri TaxID=559131 RepID=A0ABD2NZQ5_9CUCU